VILARLQLRSTKLIAQARSNRDARCLIGEECSPGTLEAATAGQVITHCLPDFGRQWHEILTVTLAAHRQNAVTPIEVVELEPGNLHRAQSEPGHQQHDRPIPGPCHGPGVTTVDRRLHFLATDQPGDLGQSPPAYRRESTAQLQRDQSLNVEEPEQSPKLGDSTFDRPSRHAAALA
jgi:hypothetical protein